MSLYLSYFLTHSSNLCIKFSIKIGFLPTVQVSLLHASATSSFITLISFSNLSSACLRFADTNFGPAFKILLSCSVLLNVKPYCSLVAESLKKVKCECNFFALLFFSLALATFCSFSVPFSLRNSISSAPSIPALSAQYVPDLYIMV